MHLDDVQEADAPVSWNLGARSTSQSWGSLSVRTSSPGMAFAVDGFGAVVEASDSAVQFLGADRVRLGMRCHDLLAGLTRDGALVCREGCPILASALHGSWPDPVDMTIVAAARDDGVVRELSVRHLPVGAGDQVRVLHLLVDVTARRRRERIGARLEDLLDGTRQAGVLTRRELDVLRLIARGDPSDRIAERLGIGTPTVRNHVARLLEKLGASNRAAALVRFILGAEAAARLPSHERNGGRGRAASRRRPPGGASRQ